jgi:small-conductance mechanosensitive channel
VRRGSVEIFVGYDLDLRQAIGVIETAAQAADGVLDEPKASVRIREIGASNIRLDANFWTDSSRADFLATTSAVRENVLKKLKEAESALPNRS